MARAAEAAGAGDVALVVGHGGEAVQKAAQGFAPQAEIAPSVWARHMRFWPRATRWPGGYDDVLVMFGDTPLIEADALAAARARLSEGPRRGHRLPHCQSSRLWAFDRKGRQAGRHPRGQGLARLRNARSNSATPPDGDFRQDSTSSWTRSATPMPRASSISPTLSRSPTRPVSRWLPAKPALKACWASTIGSSWPRPR